MYALMSRVAAPIMAGVLAILAAVAGPAGAATGWAEPPQYESQQALNAQRLMSFTADHASVAAGRPVEFSWETQGPAAGVTFRLNGQLVSNAGTRSIVPMGRDETYRLVAYSGSLKRELGTLVVGVNPCVPAGSAPQCLRAGAAKGDYARINADFFYYSAADFRNPDSRDVALDACATDPGRHGRIERYSWTLTRTGFAPQWFSSDQCRIVTRLGEGTYSAHLTARAADGAMLVTDLPVRVKDTIVVSVGDSMASGEGNPDVDGAYLPPLPGHPTAHWQDDTCHRSAFGGPAQAARRLSADPHNGVVFLSLACTGAYLSDLVTTSHRGQPPQLKQLATTLCRYACGRPIDLLIMTVGVNDVSWGKLLQACVVTYRGCDGALSLADGALPGLPAKYASVRDAIARLGLSVRHLLITGYPAHIFTAACAENPDRVQHVGEGLNDAIRHAALTYGWTYVDGVTAAFDGHDYCARSARWFVTWNESLVKQGDVGGTAHPNHVGQEEFAKLILAAYTQTTRL